MTLQNLRLLRDIIDDSIDRLEKYYTERSLEFPSLDEPYQVDAAQAAIAEPEVVETINTITAASYQLMTTVRPTFLTVLDAGSAYELSSCLRVANQSSIPEYLREAGPNGKHVNEIASAAGLEPSKLARVMRLLATHHIFREVQPNVFANNRISSYLDTGKSSQLIITGKVDKHEGTPGASAFMDHLTDEVFKASGHLYETLADPVTGPSFSNIHAPVQVAFKADKQFFSWIEEPFNERRFKRYPAAIRATSLWNDPGAIVEGYDWSSLTPDDLLIDVGGGAGMPAMFLARAFPKLRIVIQERAPVAAEGKAFWAETYPEAIKSGRVSFQVHEFFNEQPIKNASVFLVRTILHDWPDHDAMKILLNLRHAAGPKTRLIIGDYQIPYACPDTTPATALPGAKAAAAPAPLLANFGKATSAAYALDLSMLTLFNGQERTLSHLIEISRKTGWKAVQVHRRDDTPFGFLVAEPVVIPSA